jgi:hypothetical protein
MIIELKKFGNTLISRQDGREALVTFQATLREITSQEAIEIDFDGVLSFSPGWADEFITPLRSKFEDRVILRETNNPSVKATMEILDENRE